MHFTRMGGFDAVDVPIIVRGDGCHLEDSNGRRISMRSRDSSRSISATRSATRSARRRSTRCASCPSTRTGRTHTRAPSSSPPRWRRCAGRPEPRLLLLRRLRGRRVRVEACAPVLHRAWRRQPSRPRHSRRSRRRAGAGGRPRRDRRNRRPPPRRYKAIARHIAYHGTTMGALSINGIPALRAPFEPLVSEVRHVSNTNRYHRPRERPRPSSHRSSSPSSSRRSSRWGRRRCASCTWSPCRTPAAASRRPRATGAAYARSAPLRHPALGRRGDHRLRSRSVTGSRPSGTTSALHRHVREGPSSSYAALGAVVATDKVMEAFMGETSDVLPRHYFRRASRDVRDRAQEHRDHEARADPRAVRENEDAFRSTLAELLDLPIVGDVRGTAFSGRSSSSRTRTRARRSRTRSARSSCAAISRTALWDAGMICRADDRGDPVIQISPPLVAGQAEFDENVDSRRGAHGRRRAHALVVGAATAKSGHVPGTPFNGARRGRRTRSRSRRPDPSRCSRRAPRPASRARRRGHRCGRRSRRLRRRRIRSRRCGVRPGSRAERRTVAIARRASDRSRRPVEGGEEPSPSSRPLGRGSAELARTVASWCSSEVAPSPVAELGGGAVEPTMSVNSTVARTRSGSGAWLTPVRNSSTSSSISVVSPTHGR